MAGRGSKGTYVARDVPEDVWLERHVDVDGADDVAELPFHYFEYAGDEDGVAFHTREVRLCAFQPRSQHAPETSFHLRLALASTYFRSNCSRAK